MKKALKYQITQSFWIIFLLYWCSQINKTWTYPFWWNKRIYLFFMHMLQKRILKVGAWLLSLYLLRVGQWKYPDLTGFVLMLLSHVLLSTSAKRVPTRYNFCHTSNMSFGRVLEPLQKHTQECRNMLLIKFGINLLISFNKTFII